MEKLKLNLQTKIVDENCQQQSGNGTVAMGEQEWRVAATMGPGKASVLYAY
jgi:hypothetical protein